MIRCFDDPLIPISEKCGWCCINCPEIKCEYRCSYLEFHKCKTEKDVINADCIMAYDIEEGE